LTFQQVMEKLTDAEKKEILEPFGKRLEALIYERFKTKEKFLRDTGFFKANLHQFIKGEVDPQLTTLHRLANAIGITVEELVGEKKLKKTKAK